MRRLWTDDVIWTRQYIVEAVAGAPDAQAAAERLLKNQEDIGNAFVPFYGEEMGGSLTDLLKSHVLIAVDLVNAAIVDDEQQFRRQERRWNDNAGEIAAFLSETNPCWPVKDVQDLLSRELSFTKRELGARFEEDWERDIQSFDDMLTEILTMADALSEGLVSQFPDRFDAPGYAATSSTMDQELSRPREQVASALVEAERRAAGAEARLTALQAEADELHRLVGRLEVERAGLCRQLEISERALAAEEPEPKAEEPAEAPAALIPSTVPTIISSPFQVNRSSFMKPEAKATEEPGEAPAAEEPAEEAAEEPVDAEGGPGEEPGTEAKAEPGEVTGEEPAAEEPGEEPAEEAAAEEPEPATDESQEAAPKEEAAEELVWALLEARAEGDEEALYRLMAEDVVYHIPGEGPYVGREAVLAAWNRQAALLEEGDIEADLLDFAATGDHVFTYVEARGQIRGTGRPFSYTTVTVYRIRGDQIVEVRPHIHDLDAYDEFWSSVEPGTEAESEREEPAEATAAEQPRTEAEPGEG